MKRISLRVTFVVVVLLEIVLLVTTYSYAVLSERYKAQQQSESQQLQTCSRALGVIESYFNMLDTVSTFPVQRDALNRNTELFLAWANSTDVVSDLNVRRLFWEAVFEEYPLFPEVEMIAMYTLEGNGLYNTRHGVTSTYETACKLERDTVSWFEEALNAKGAPIFIPVSGFQHTGIPSEENLFCVARSLMDVSTSDYHSIGVIVVGINTGAIESLFPPAPELPESQYWVLYGDRVIVGDRDKLPEKVLEKASQEEDVMENFYMDQGSDSYLYSLCSRNRCKVITRADLSLLNTSADRFGAPFYVLLVVLALLHIAVVFLILGGILIPTRIIIGVCQKFQGDRIHIPKNHLIPKEFNDLFLEFQKMSERISSLIHEVLLKDLQQKDSELKLLRTQINPHFIYNTLQIIQSKAYLQQAYDVAAMSELLAVNLRYGLRNPSQEVPLSQEVTSVTKYLDLMGYHFGTQVEYHLHFSNELLKCHTIKLILQPLVENSLVHGIDANHRTLAVDISGYCSNKVMVISVTDNGCGMSAEKLAELRLSLDRDDVGGSIGLKNVHQRLKLYYGDSYGIEIQSVLGKGTCVTLKLPCEL
jgi:two-component system sensor histidine kinase YesM